MQFFHATVMKEVEKNQRKHEIEFSVDFHSPLFAICDQLGRKAEKKLTAIKDLQLITL